ncbi:DUF99 family protein [Halopenitus sp. H-Gu1]|uniref:endonuclease dU n=1 Tax=Halopenitus sp. H-Gu1 TaxID=3242697 RepID=UPI00359E0953
MKPGSRSLGIAFSDGPERSRIGGALVRVNGRVDDLVGGSCDVGGTDATAAVIDIFETLDREDVRRLVIAGIAPAWFNLVDLRTVHRAVDRPVLSVSFEASPGLEPAIREAFDGDERRDRLAIYRSLPDRHRVGIGGSGVDGDSIEDETTSDLFVRSAGIEPERADEIVRALRINDAQRPEPVRVAKRTARAFRRFAAAPE